MRSTPAPPAVRVIALPPRRMADAVDVLADSFRDYPAMRYFIGPVGRH